MFGAGWLTNKIVYAALRIGGKSEEVAKVVAFTAGCAMSVALLDPSAAIEKVGEFLIERGLD